MSFINEERAQYRAFFFLVVKRKKSQITLRGYSYSTGLTIVFIDLC